MKIDPNLCPICGEGTLVPHHHDREDEVDGYKFVIRNLQHSICDHCHERVTTPKQSRHNKLAIIEARAWAVADRDQSQRLSSTEILAIRKRLGLTQAQAARVFGGGANAFSKYENNEVTPSDGMEKLLRLADEVPQAASWLLRRGGVPNVTTRDMKWAAIHSALESSIKNELARRIHQQIIEAVSSKLANTDPISSARTSFTFMAEPAANDPESYKKPDLIAVG